MKFVAIVYLVLILIFGLISAFLLYFQRPGWGWFLLVAVLFGAGFSYSEKD